MSDWVFPPPYLPRERYRARILPRPEDADRGSWPRCRVVVERNDGLGSGPENDIPVIWTKVAEYDRNYSFLKTFEPFRQLRDGEWRDYALISRRYTYLEVMDLQTGEVIATEQPSEKDLEDARANIEKHKDTPEPEPGWKLKEYTPEQVARGWGFCPVEFYVPDFLEEWDERESHKKSFEDQIEELEKERVAENTWWDESDERLRGDFGVYCGCVWGDDTSMKVQYVDLQKIREGVVTTDDRFGYIQLHPKLSLKESVRYFDEGDRFEIAVSIDFDRESGKAGYYNKRYINFDEKED